MVENSRDENAFRYEYNVPLTPEFEHIFTSPYEWYMGKNKDFKKLSDIPDLSVPEFECIITSMVKDLLLIQFLNKVPKPKLSNPSKLQNLETIDNLSNLKYTEIVTEIRSKAYELLKRFEKLIFDGYKYQEFLKLLHDYIGFFSNMNNPSKKKECDYSMRTLLEFADMPSIIVPTFFQINYEWILNTMAAPIINFRLSNRRKKIHGNFLAPCNELLHDISAHGAFMHPFTRGIKTLTDRQYAKSYENRNRTIQLLKNLYGYLQETDDEKWEKKYIAALILFSIFHETASLTILNPNLSLKDVIGFCNKLIEKIIQNQIKGLDINKIINLLGIEDEILNDITIEGLIGLVNSLQMEITQIYNESSHKLMLNELDPSRSEEYNVNV